MTGGVDVTVAPTHEGAPPAGPPLGRRDHGEPTEAWDWAGLVARLEPWIGRAVVVACCVWVFVELHPRLLLRDTTPAGGDMGAHVWFPKFLRDHLLPFHLSGWAPDWFAGFPAGVFYFPLPALLIVLVNLVAPYNVAFKLVTVLGSVLLPAGAYMLGRGLRAPRPMPEAMAVGAVGFLAFTGDPGVSDIGKTIQFNQHIMGGNLASTLAGEYSFSLALALALFFLGTLASTLRTRRAPWLPAVLLAATVTSHLVVGIFAAVAALIVWLCSRPGRTIGRAAAIAVVGALLTAVWLVPLVASIGYTTDMRYEPIGVCPESYVQAHQCGSASYAHYADYLFPHDLFVDRLDGLAHGHLPLPFDWGAYALGGIALVGGVVWLRRSTLNLAAVTVGAGLLFYNWEGLHALVGRTPAWNLRLLPFWYLGIFLLEAVGVAEILLGLAWLTRRGTAAWMRRSPSPSGRGPVGRTAGLVRSLTVLVLVVTLATLALRAFDRRKTLWPYWASWNYSGYEQTDTTDPTPPAAKAYPEYRALVDTLAALPPGRLMWEGGSAIDRYGTTLALMLLPYWTDGRIASMEGLYYEASATTPYHFLTVATLSGPGNASNPERGLDYLTIDDFHLGVRYLRLLGVRYYAAMSDTAIARADADPGLVPIATSPDLDGQPPGTWHIYRVRAAPLVEPLRYQPVVVTGIGSWETDVGAPWWGDTASLDRPLVAAGPAGWAHAAPRRARKVPQKLLARTTRVSHVRTTRDTVSFDVSRPGAPVMVKVSYFPSWRVEGAKGPYRATPNYMVVVPTSRHVRLSYATSGAEWLGWLLTLLGLAGVGLLASTRARRRTARALAWVRPGAGRAPLRARREPGGTIAGPRQVAAQPPAGARSEPAGNGLGTDPPPRATPLPGSPPP